MEAEVKIKRWRNSTYRSHRTISSYAQTTRCLFINLGTCMKYSEAFLDAAQQLIDAGRFIDSKG